ncbi:MAG: hypothetical protein P8R54_31740 [Myxococcota bacterium]|nr:hypothetical protein [Myxococcota bacterium]
MSSPQNSIAGAVQDTLGLFPGGLPRTLLAFRPSLRDSTVEPRDNFGDVRAMQAHLKGSALTTGC